MASGGKGKGGGNGDQPDKPDSVTAQCPRCSRWFTAATQDNLDLMIHLHVVTEHED